VSITTAQMKQIEHNRYESANKRWTYRISEVARIATELQNTTPGLGRTDALMIAEDIMKEKEA
jgi:hypothetical protein